MNSQLQNFSDLKQIMSTDKRYVAAGAFVVLALFIWLSTTTWRQPPAASPERFKLIKIEEQQELNTLIKDFNSVLGQAKEERAYLRDSIHRFKNDVDADREQFDWKMNSLVQKLEGITDTVDGLTNKIGSSKIQSTKLEQQLLLQKKNKRRRNIQVSASEIR